MLSLTIKEIEEKCFYNTLPKKYRVVGKNTINPTGLFSLLYNFDYAEEMYYFLKALSQSATIELDYQGKKAASPELLIVMLFQNKAQLKTLKKKHQEAVNKFVKKYITATQLITIFKSLSPQTIYELYLQKHLIPAETLEEIFNDRGNLKILSEKIQKMIYRYLCRFHNADETPFIEMMYFSSRFAHTLALSGAFIADGFNISFEEGEYQHFSFTILTEQLEKYVPPVQNHAAFQQILKSYQFTQALLQQHEHDFSESAAHLLFQRYKNNELVTLPSYIPRHTYGIALYGDYLVYCNRGAGRQSHFNCAIFPLKTNITAQTLQQLPFFKDIASLNTFLSSLVDLDHPLYVFFNSPQKYPNCTYTNLKTIIGALHPLVEVPANSPPRILLAKLKSIPHRSDYKRFTHQLRCGELDLLINRMEHATHPLLIKFYAFVVKQILRLHPGKGRHPIKAQRELKRANFLLEHIPEPIMAELNKDNDFVAFLRREKFNTQVLAAPTDSTLPSKLYVKQFDQYAAAASNSTDALTKAANRLLIKF